MLANFNHMVRAFLKRAINGLGQIRKPHLLLSVFLLVALLFPRLVLSETNIPISHPKIRWDQERVMTSVARVVSQTCFGGSCPDLKEDGSARVSTGFVVNLPKYGKVLVTALHNIAGASRVTYQFTKREGLVPEKTSAIAVSMNGDVALLRLTDNDRENVKALTLATSIQERDELLSVERGIVAYGHGLASAYIRPQSGKLNPQLAEPLRILLNVNGGKFAIDAIEKAGYPSLDKVKFIAIQNALLPGDSGGPILSHRKAIVIGMSHGGIPISQGKIEWMLPSERLIGIQDYSIDPRKLPMFGPQDVVYSTSIFFPEGPLKRTPLRRTPSARFNIQITKTAPFVFEYLSRVSHWARVPQVREEWEKLPSSDFNRRTNRIDRTSKFYPGHKDAGKTCGWNLKSETCEDLISAEADLSSLIDGLTLEINCFDQRTFDRLLSDASFDRPDRLLGLKMDLGPIGDKVEFSVDYGAGFISLNSKGYMDYVPGRGNYSHVGLKNVEQLFGGACRIRFDGNRNLDSKWRPLIRAFNKSIERSGSVCVELSISDTILMPLYFTEYLPVGAEDFDQGNLWGLLPLNNIKASSDEVYCQ